ncbi:MAG: hypothetical protein JKY40_06980 [Gammaproteobacteria bacterium]|nr:hypothetical protein [Gammaproteobacteria bacterium]
MTVFSSWFWLPEEFALSVICALDCWHQGYGTILLSALLRANPAADFNKQLTKPGQHEAMLKIETISVLFCSVLKEHGDEECDTTNEK